MARTIIIFEDIKDTDTDERFSVQILYDKSMKSYSMTRGEIMATNIMEQLSTMKGDNLRVDVVALPGEKH